MNEPRTPDGVRGSFAFGKTGTRLAEAVDPYAASRAVRLAAWTFGSGTGADSMSSRV